MNVKKHSRKVLIEIIAPILLIIFTIRPVFPGNGATDDENKVYLPYVEKCPSPAFPLINGNFELGNAGWTFSNYKAGIVTSGEDGITPHGGSQMAFMDDAGIIGGDPPGYIEQSFTIPDCASYLSFWWASIVYCGGTSGQRCEPHLIIDINGTTVSSLSAGLTSWQKIVLDTGTYRGSTITIRFTAAASFLDGVVNYIDDLEFTNPPLPGAFSKSSPANQASDQPSDLTLTWEASSYPVYYEYCFDSTDDNACTTSWVDTGLERSATLTGLTPGIYYWHVRARNVTGTTYANGETTWWSFTVPPEPGAFHKLTPSNGATNQFSVPYMTWEASSNASSYEYCIDSTNDNSCSTSWIYGYPNPLAAGTYYWQVRAANATGSTYADGGAWWSFTIPPKPGAFSKLSPPDGATNQPPNLQLNWEASSDALLYIYCVSKDGYDMPGSEWIVNGTSTSADISNLSPGIYFWQVRAENGAGTTYANGGIDHWDPVWSSFTVP